MGAEGPARQKTGRSRLFRQFGADGDGGGKDLHGRMRPRRAPLALAIALATVRGGAGFRAAAPFARIGPRRCSAGPDGILPPPTTSWGALRSTASDGGAGEAERLRQTASKLREEARAAEEALGSTRGASAPSSEGAAYVKPAEYSELGDSCWEITYRFANEPEPKEEKDTKKDGPPRKFYGGKLQLQFKEDGYTDIISTGEADGDRSNAATFQKVWGWDLETSERDSLDYVLFSADISLPPPISASERFYFQARVDRGGKDKDVISLQEGSVTVKRDIEAPGGGWWGIFRGADGILAQFRQVGEFRCRPVARPVVS